MIAETSTTRPHSWLDLYRDGKAFITIALQVAVVIHASSTFLVATILPSAVAEMGGLAYMNWTSTGYLAGSILGSATGGWMKSRVGGRAAFSLAAAAFAAGCLVAAASPSMDVLIGGRVLQGISGGLWIATVYAVLREVYPREIWARSLAGLSAMWGIAAFVGPAIGGVFAEFGLWRWSFVAVAPIALVTVLLAASRLPRQPPGRTASATPWLSLCLVILAIAAGSVASLATDWRWSVAMMLVAGLSFWLAARPWGRARLLPSRGFANASTVGPGLLTVFGLMIGSNLYGLYIPYFLQRLHGYSPLGAGYVDALEGLAWTGAALATAWIAGRRQDRVMAIGPLIAVAGMVLGVFIIAGGPLWLTPLPGILLGAGIGLAWAPLGQRIMASPRPGEEDVTAGSIASLQAIGGATGAILAGLGTTAAGMTTPEAPTPVVSAAAQSAFLFCLAGPLLAAVMAEVCRRRSRGVMQDD